MSGTLRLACTFFAFAAVVAGCGVTPDLVSGDGANPQDLARSLGDGMLGDGAPALGDAAMVLDLAGPSAYPAGPYGATVGDTLPPLQWIGYFDPHTDAVATTKPYAAYSMNDLRTSGRPYALVHISEFI